MSEAVTKVSEISRADIIRYIKEDDTDSEIFPMVDSLMNAAKSFISSYTGIPINSEDEKEETLDTFPDFVIVVYILVQDMWDNRALYVDKSNINRTVESILNMHSRNLL